MENRAAPRINMVGVIGADADAEASLKELEAGFGYAIELEDQFSRHSGRPHPLFDAPAAGLYMLASCLEASKEQAALQGDSLGVTTLIEVEEKVMDRVHALAEVHPDPEVSVLAVEMIPRQARRRGDVAP